ncbi:TrmB family transcriptional regulator [Halocatena halophila]|uniref:TrmB family transcriptional regulator n=1 Tax=Halocatena halophila TaxID=2814576 RepID=UPI002ED55FF6
MTSNGRPHDDLREKLGVFGLTDGEIDAYFALLSRGEATTRVISEDADVTQQAVYKIVERLEHRGLVRVNDHASPTTTRALPPKEAIANLTDQLESIQPSLDALYTRTEPQAPDIRMIKSRETAVKGLRRAIARAQQEALVAVPERVVSDIESELKAAVDRDVFVVLLVGEMDSVDERTERYVGLADVVRCRTGSLQFMYAIDFHSTMMGSTDIFSGVHTDESVVSVTETETNITGLVVATFFGVYWPVSTEVFVTDPYSLPKTFEWFRSATLHAALYDSLGSDLCAVVETTDGTELSGPVTEICQAFVEPATNDFTVENNLSLQIDNNEVRIGGPGSFIEEYEAERITLRLND